MPFPDFCLHSSCITEMSGLSNFAIRIQSWFFKTQSKSNHSPKIFVKCKSKSKWSPKYLKSAAFSQQKCRTSFPLTQSKPGPVPKVLKRFTPRIQSKFNKICYISDPVQPKSSPMLISVWSLDTEAWKDPSEDTKWMIVQCATFTKSLNPQNIDKSVFDILICIRFPFKTSFLVSVSSCQLYPTGKPDSCHLCWVSEMSGLWNFSVRVESWSDIFESDPVLIRQSFWNHHSDPVSICQCKIMHFEAK